MSIQWGAVCRPKEGQSISGDSYIVLEQTTSVLVGVVDGLGGGEAAAEAADGAIAVIREHPAYSLEQLIRTAHERLHHTRGAVIGLMRMQLAANKMQFVGVGNIGVHVLSSRPIKPISKNGILGYRLPTLLLLDYVYNSGDTFVLYSDGISSRFALDHTSDFTMAPQALAEAILANYGKHNDDATVVVIRT
ncbi:MAG: SpoIIE family protein phosphatase [Chloroflexaceae bacterium]|nr:SpoIIE family protein phosphatase [Chloroflexaceae bacterium]NJO04391.1 SpoIIE family protein phosphatase [Chloroflexaceae bacterium]